MTRLQPDPSRFYDGGSLDGGEQPEPASPLVVLLERVLVPKRGRLPGPGGRPRLKETFLLQRRIAYRARWSAGGVLEIVVPAAVGADVPPHDRFRSDLTSVPDLFTWLVPRTGSHLPAALVHDGLIYGPGEPASYQAAASVPRIEADRIFRDAMADLGTGLVRRWLMWSAVTLATVAAGVTSVAPPGSTTGGEDPPTSAGGGRSWVVDLYYRLVVFGSLFFIGALGVVATLDFFDVWDVLPWMGDRSGAVELVLGAVFAVVIPAVLSVAWLRFWRAGVITGVALALLLHVTLALAALTFAFQVMERLTSPRRREIEASAPVSLPRPS